jgi:hypothetical protein
MQLIWLLCVLFIQADIPYKPTEEFEIKLDYQFKQRPQTDSYNSNGERIQSSGVLPYLLLNVKIIKPGEGEMRYKVMSNVKGNLANRRVEAGAVYVIDVGFTDDVKDRVTAHEYTILFLSEKKEPLSKILISVAEDGTFYVNETKRGKF